MNHKLENNRKYISADLFETFELSELRNLSAKELFELGKIQCPFYKSSNDETYSAITYSDALEIITKKINSIDPVKSFFYASGRSSNEASFLLDLFARTMGCNHVNTCSNYCHEASGIALNASLSPSYTLAGPSCLICLVPATLNTAPSGAKFPFNIIKPPVRLLGEVWG